jgi:hypothetical protein
VLQFARAKSIEARVLRRCGYAFQREGIALAGAEDVRAAAATASAPDAFALAYDDGEHIVVPERAAGHTFEVVEGSVAALARTPSDGEVHEVRRTRGEWLSLMQRALAQRIGPYAAYAVQEASARHGSLAEIHALLAREIDDEAARASFLGELAPPDESSFGPGYRFACRRDAAQRLVADPPLHAVRHARILASPSAAA